MNIEMIGWIFSLGGILGYLTMLFHSYLTNKNRFTGFIFGGGFIIAFLLELTLVKILNQYDYQNLPLTILDIPIVIPAGWVVTFYGLHTIAQDLTKNNYYAIILTGLLGVLFGIGLETLANNVEFWIFHFEFAKFLGIPINVVVAWGLSTSNFAMGIVLYDKYRKKSKYTWIVVLLIIHFINIIVALILVK